MLQSGSGTVLEFSHGGRKIKHFHLKYLLIHNYRLHTADDQFVVNF